MLKYTMERYSIITEKNPREIVLLRGSGCKWRRCSFCDYHLDFSLNEKDNYELNKAELDKVTGKYSKLEVINSGSFVDLDEYTIRLIRQICVDKMINELHFECHWMHRDSVDTIKKFFIEKGIQVKIKIGVESFDYEFREKVLVKGIDEETPQIISEKFDEVCLLMGITGQTKESMLYDIETGLKYFERVCINIMVENGTKIKPDTEVIRIFKENIYDLYAENERVDILMHNTDFGVG